MDKDKESSVEVTELDEKLDVKKINAGMHLSHWLTLVIVSAVALVAIPILCISNWSSNNAVSWLIKSNEDNVNELAFINIAMSADIVKAELEHISQLDDNLNFETLYFMQQNIIDSGDMDVLYHLFLAQFKRYPTASYYQYGDEPTGNYMGLVHFHDGTIGVEYRIDNNSTLCSVCPLPIRYGEKEYRIVNSDGSIGNLWNNKKYDSRLRPWYQAVKNITANSEWDGVTAIPLSIEPFSNNVDIGDGFGVPVFNSDKSFRGVLSWKRSFVYFNSIILPNLIKRTPTSITYVMTESGLNIASTINAENVRNADKIGNEKISLLEVLEMKDPFFAATYNMLLNASTNNLKSLPYHFQNYVQDYLFSSVHTDHNGFIIVSGSKQVDFLGNIMTLREILFQAIQSQNVIVIIVAFVIMSVVILASVILSSKFITKPLKAMTEKMQSASNFDFRFYSKSKVQKRSSVKEIHVIEATFEFMVKKFAAGLRNNRKARFNTSSGTSSNPNNSINNSITKKDTTSKTSVLVDGIMNELAHIVKNYWIDNIAAIKEIGVTYDNLRFSSAESIVTNADKLYGEIIKISQKVKVPIILIGHSMGGAEAAYLFLKYPHLLLDGTIDKVVSLNGAIGGSKLADNLSPLGHAMSLILGSGLHSLKEGVAKKNFDEGFAMFQKTVADEGYKNGLTPSSRFEFLSKKLFYIRSALPQGSEVSAGLKVVLTFCSIELDEFPNDRLLTAKAQMIQSNPPLGQDLGIIDADHMALLINGIASSGDISHRKAFTNAILQAVVAFN
ncbi:hypothetical protein HK099_003882 [Clydaea vesicula]|uniref:Uncharacterized protein n=1 Tax=Clydaea vesicula TaxID=447962 RepID=A0AAD5U133_9FUNG|nr:hypothetical protein HK099_003882 [Clydaea vesicula]